MTPNAGATLGRREGYFSYLLRAAMWNMNDWNLLNSNRGYVPGVVVLLSVILLWSGFGILYLKRNKLNLNRQLADWPIDL